MLRTLLTLLFYVIVVPAGLLTRLVKDPMSRRPDPRVGSYWITSTGRSAGERTAR